MTKKKVKVTKKVKSTGDSSSSKTIPGTKKVKVKPTKSRIKSGVKTPTNELTFNKENYMWMGIGFAGILVGLVLMMGGGMPSPDMWDENIIYNFRRITLAPLLILAGLSVVVYGIFK